MRDLLMLAAATFIVVFGLLALLAWADVAAKLMF